MTVLGNNIAWFKELNKQSLSVAGGKGANLGEMYNSGFPIPPGFVVTAQAYKLFLESTGITGKIYSILKGLDVENNDALQESSRKVQKVILDAKMPDKLKEEIVEAYDAMSIDKESLQKARKEVLNLLKSSQSPVFVAVRSSATAEDLPSASFAGQQATFLNVRGGNQLVSAVQKCWASLFTARAVYYRVKNNFPHEKVLIAVVVQKMVNSIKSGVIFSVNPVSQKENEIVIEAGWGLGEAVVSGAINPNEYIVDKPTMRVIEKKITEQTWMYTRDPSIGSTIRKEVAEDKRKAQVLTDFEIKKLANITLDIESHYKKPQDIEYAIDGQEIYIVQSRPITTLKKRPTSQKVDEKLVELSKAKILVEGLSASPGFASGTVKIVYGPQDFGRIKVGDVLVTEMTDPDMVPTMQRACAIVTESGGTTCHAAIVSREMGIPCIVGTQTATKVLKEGQIITVDANIGKVYEGKVEIKAPAEDEAGKEAEKMGNMPIETVTEVKVIMDLPQFAEKAAATGADGVGLLRAEFMIITEENEHPAYLVKIGRREELVGNLEKGMREICAAFKGKPVWYRISDLRTDEYKHLKGSDEEPHEDNPMLGWHGIRRSLDEIDFLKAELEAIKRVHDSGYTNIGVMIPMVTHIEQVRETKKILKEIGLEPLENIDFGVMVETPAAVQIIKEICEEGVDFISFGTNDLTQFTLAIDRNNAKVQKWYSEMHPAVLRQLAYVIKVCKEYGVETSICGQAGSNPEMAEFLVKVGIDSISSNVDAVFKIRQVVARAEKKLLLKVARKDLEF